MTRAAFWLGLALLAHASALQLIEAGPVVRYQHYRPLAGVWNERPWAAGILAVQAVLVPTVLLRSCPGMAAWFRRNFQAWRLAAIGLVLVGSSAALSRDPLVYLGEICLASWLQAVNVANFFLLARAVPSGAISTLAGAFDRWLGRPDETDPPAPRRFDPWPWWGAAFVASVAAALSWFVYERHPHVPDELVYLYPARYFAAGQLAMPAPPVVEAFDLDLMEYQSDRWYSPVPPGWPAMLAVGVLCGAPWLVNPVLGGVNVLLCYALVRHLYDRPLARLTALLLAVAPWHLFLAMSFMTHTFALTCGLAAAAAVARSQSTGRASWAWLGGTAVGVLSLIRPLEGLVVAVLLGLWGLGLGGRRLRLASLAGLVLGTAFTGALVFPYNQSLTGDPWTFPINAYTDKHYGPGSNSLGFGSDRGLGWTGLDPFPGHGARDVLVNLNLNLSAVNVELLGWSTGSLLAIGLLLASNQLLRADRALIASILAIIGIHCLYWFAGGPDFGARYWFLIIVPCLALTARGIWVLPELLDGTRWHNAPRPEFTRRGSVAPPIRPGAVRTRVIAGALCLSLTALATFVPWRAADKYHHYRGMRPDIRQLADQHRFGKSLVLIRGKRHPDYASAAAYNPIDLNAPVPVYAWDRDSHVRSRLLSAFGDRVVWLVDGPSVTGGGYRLAQGPVSARGLLAANRLAPALDDDL